MRNAIPSENIFAGICLRLIGSLALILACQTAAIAGPQISTSEDGRTMTVDDAAGMEVLSFGKSVIVKKEAKGVFAWGGDIVVEGRVENDVAVLGGSVVHKEKGYIGGDVIVFGGTYKTETRNPLRQEGKKTVIFGAFEEELREIVQNPTSIFSPTFSLAFIAQRIISVLFWFVVTLAFATLAPGAVSRSIARFQLSTLKITAIGFAAFLLTTIAVIASFNILPDYLSVIVGLMSLVLFMLAYVFGRVVLQVSAGKMLQKYFLSEKNQSETLAIFIGVLAWTVLLSIPYVWTLALFLLFAAGIGLVITARSPRTWKTA